MTREMGSLGKDVAMGLSVQLGLAVVHHELVEYDIAERMHLRRSEVHRFLEGSPSLLERWKIDPKRLCGYTAEEVLQLARHGNVVIRGWGATELLKGIPHVLRVRVCAPLPARVNRMMQRMKITDPEIAQREIERSDAAHDRVMSKFFGTDWHDPLNYHLVLNTGLLPIKACIAQLEMLVHDPCFAVTEESRNALADKMIEARIRTALDESAIAGFMTADIDISVTAGRVLLSGAALTIPQIQNVETLVGGVDGVLSIQNEILSVPDTPLI
jgi:cytidylate kinase